MTFSDVSLPVPFLASRFALHRFSFLWGKVPRKILQENPRKNPPKFIQQKSPTHKKARAISTAVSLALPPALRRWQFPQPLCTAVFREFGLRGLVGGRGNATSIARVGENNAHFPYKFNKESGHFGAPGAPPP